MRSNTPAHDPFGDALPKSRPAGKPEGQLGRYLLYQRIGKGGMGEVRLAFDPVCGRQVALKRIRSDLKGRERLLRRFLWEARLTSQLMHPTVIPIYDIHVDGDLIYYTMPYVEGPTLKRVLIDARKKEDDSAAGIPTLVRTFVQVCQAVAYAHDQGVLHRDLKLENVIAGDYGQVFLLDWGLAKRIDEEEHDPDFEEEMSSAEITRPGKVVGTISHMAPERVLGEAATVQTEVYALGVMLYQLLTLRLPFKRPKTLAEFRQQVQDGVAEELPEPSEVAPYREVSRMLSRITRSCLDPNPKTRYASVHHLVSDLENYLGGRSEWFPLVHLDPKKKEDWQFQELVLLPEYTAITRESASTNWMSLMVSNASVTGNMRVTARVRFGPQGYGLGFLLNVPEPSRRSRLYEGYSLWIGTDRDPAVRLYRSGVEVLSEQRLACERGHWYHVVIEKIDSHITLYLDGHLEFSYISHLPLRGTHVGLLARDGEYEIEDLTVHVGSMQIQVSCLAVPDAFLANRDYGKALEEYRRIGSSFPSRAEGREALFRAGITLIERARWEGSNSISDAAVEEFEKLQDTPGAPLEHLGKALAYQARDDRESELNALELGLRKYPKHPLRHILEDQLLFRMYESSQTHRPAAYRFMLMTAQLLSDGFRRYGARKVFDNVQEHWEHLPFILPTDAVPPRDRLDLALRLAFWLNRPFSIQEIIQQTDDHTIIGNGIACLRVLEHPDLADAWTESNWPIIPRKAKELNTEQWRAAEIELDRSLLRGKLDEVLEEYQRLKRLPPPPDGVMRIDAHAIWTLMLANRYEEAGSLLSKQPRVLLNQPALPLHGLYGCWLRATEGEEAALFHFSSVMRTPFPRSWTTLSHWLLGHIREQGRWFSQSFAWERRQLFRLLALYHHCGGDEEKAQKFQQRAQQEIPFGEE